MQKLPKEIKVGGQIYQIIEKDRIKEDGIVSYGTHDGRQSKIWIASDVSQRQKETTLLHEIIESINFANQLELKEQQIWILENNLYQVLKDNKLGFQDENDKEKIKNKSREN